MATMRPLTEGSLREEFFTTTSQLQSYEQHRRVCGERLADLKVRAHAAGLAKVFHELAHPKPTPPRIEEAMTRVRVRESFSGQWNGMPYDGAAGAIIDVPRSYAKHAVAMFEIVDPSTPLFTPPPIMPWPR